MRTRTGCCLGFALCAISALSVTQFLLQLSRQQEREEALMRTSPLASLRFYLASIPQISHSATLPLVTPMQHLLNRLSTSASRYDAFREAKSPPKTGCFQISPYVAQRNIFHLLGGKEVT